MIKCDPVTRAALNAATSKIQWANTLNTAVGQTKRIRCFRDANANATDPFTTGVEFRNVGCTGSFKIVGGRIVGLGKIKGTTISQPADMGTGKSIVRVEGNGRWFEMSLGLTKEVQIARGIANPVAYDFPVRGNFTATNGFASTPTFALSGTRFLASGTGLAAPAKVASSPHKLELWNHTNNANPTLVNSLVFDNRIDDFVYEDAEMAADTGDGAVWQSTQSIMYGIHEFGATMTISPPQNTVAGVNPLYEIVVNMATRGAWTTYPAADTFPAQATTTHPDPFKIKVFDQNNNLLYTFQQQDGLPINSPDMYQAYFDTTKPLRPHTNTGMALHWWSERPKMSDKATKWYPGLTADGQRPTQAKTHYSFLASPPLVTGGYQRNSLNGCFTFWATDRWPRPYGGFNHTPPDPFLSNDFNRGGGSAYGAPWACGWDYEPGSYAAHDWFTGPGGPRQDRCVIPSVLAMWVSQPTGKRLASLVPWRDMADGFIRSYWNHSNKWVSNVKTMTLASNEDILQNWNVIGNYYGDAPVDPKKAINQRAVGNGGSRDPAYHDDSKGEMFWGGFARDSLHSYCESGWAALLLKSHMFALCSKFDVSMQFMMHGGGRGGDQLGDYMVRTQAWNWLHHVIAWKLASTHPLYYTRKQIEDRFVVMLEGLYDQLYVPAFVENNPADKFKAIRNLGVWDFDGGGAMGGGLGFYMAHVLQLMKQTGMWATIKKRGGKAWTALRMQMRNMDEFVFGYIVDTNASYGHYVRTGLPVPDSWAAFQARNPAVGQEDWNREANGNVIGERDVADHLFAHYAYIRRDFFPEETHPKLAAACAKFDMYYQRVKDRVAISQSFNDDHTYRYPGIAPIKAPAELGPATIV